MENRHPPDSSSCSSESEPETGVMDEDLEHIARELPPPYTFNPSTNNNNIPGQQFPILTQPQSDSRMDLYSASASSCGNISNSISNHVMTTSMEELHLNERLAIVQSLKTIRHLFIKLSGKAVGGMGFVNIEKENGDILFSDKVSAYGSDHSISEPSNVKALVRMQQELKTMQVECLGQRLGFIHNNNTLGKSYSVTSTSPGQTNFLIQGTNTFGLTYFPGLTKGEFRILTSSGEQIGSMNKTYGTFGLSFPLDTDTNSKILLLAAGIMIYIGYFADTGCSTSGIRGMNCFCCNLAKISRF